MLIGIAVILLAGLGLWQFVLRNRSSANVHTPPEEDPRLIYNGPFQNIHPAVQYVGDAKCAECHEPIAEKFRHHPMGRSIVAARDLEAGLSYDVKSHNPFKGLETEFLVEHKDGKLVYRQSARDDKGDLVYDSTTPIDYALGSGTHGYAYLTNREGFVFEAPVSWFSQKHIWDVSPGYPPDWRSGRPVAAECLFCHSNRVEAMDGYPNRYSPSIFKGLNIGCERCHGPGERHVAKQTAKPLQTGLDHSIVNPRHLASELRESICNQCHITGEARVVPRGRGLQDFRPGLPLEQFRSILVLAKEPGTERKAVNQVEQMYECDCYVKSVEDSEHGKFKLGCISCHDPHEHVAADQRVKHYRQACQQCHQEHGCSVEESTRRQTVKDDSCIECHMPRYASEDIPHNASTNHRIIKRPMNAETDVAPRKRVEPRYVFFQEQRIDVNNPERKRDYGIGMSHVIGRMHVNGQRPAARIARQTLDQLNEAVRNDPTDWDAWETKAKLLTVLDRTDEALVAYKTVLETEPHREISLMGAAMSAHSIDRLQEAAELWGRAVAESPWRASHRAAYAQVLRQLKRWKEACEQAEAWIRLDPPNVDARLMLVICLVNAGDKKRAREEFSRIERLKPSNLPVMQAHFAAEMGEN
jgi:Flp pilus assembly protein TadD